MTWTIAQRGIETEGIEWVVPGSVLSAWITDPEGNRIQIGQGPAESA